jgi:hypothetical protein
VKKICALAIALLFAFIFVACGDDDTEEKANSVIGTIGPGGGIIFFVAGELHKECSPELGMHTWSAAITTAGNFSGGGLTDWALPTDDELNLMYRNLHRRGLGGFSNTTYWSSAEDSFGDAGYMNFQNGSWYFRGGSKSQNHRVRAVRSFVMGNTDITPPQTDVTSLTIKNESSHEITEVFWNAVEFGNEYTVGSGQITVIHFSIRAGESVTKTVHADSAFIHLKLAANPIGLRTEALIVVDDKTQVEFVFRNNTAVVDEQNTSNTGTLASFSSM